MSQRLHIGPTNETRYDCVLTTAEGAEDKLWDEWLLNGQVTWPLKIRIGDLALWREVEPVVAATVRGVGEHYPDEVWRFYYGDREIGEPTEEGLRALFDDSTRPGPGLMECSRDKARRDHEE